MGVPGAADPCVRVAEGSSLVFEKFEQLLVCLFEITFRHSSTPQFRIACRRTTNPSQTYDLDKNNTKGDRAWMLNHKMFENCPLLSVHNRFGDLGRPAHTDSHNNDFWEPPGASEMNDFPVQGEAGGLYICPRCFFKGSLCKFPKTDTTAADPSQQGRECCGVTYSCRTSFIVDLYLSNFNYFGFTFVELHSSWTYIFRWTHVCRTIGYPYT